ncbi:YdeI/OmpD-associated family protein [soil metagenome]
MATKEPKPEQPIIFFETAEDWEKWLIKHHENHQGIWLRMYKKATKKPTITYAEALDVALCYGWIDGQKNSYDNESWLQKFTMRGKKSIWSLKNTEHIARLTKAGLMKPAGQAAIDAAKADGRWDNAYASGKNAEMPEDFLSELAKNHKAKAFFETLNKSNTYAIYFRITNVKKAETRERKIKQFIEMLERGDKVHLL